MIHIVNKGYKYIQTQIEDFCGIIVNIVISLKSAEGRKKYVEVFKRKPSEKAKKIKTRILSIFQTKITEYSGKVVRIIRKCTDIVCGNLRILFKENNTIQKKKPPKTIPILVDQTKLTDFIDGAVYLLKRKIKLPYKTKPIKVTEDYLSGKIPDDQKIAFQEYPNFDGYLNNIFRLNPSIDIYFSNLQLKLDYEPQDNHDFLNLNNIFKIELARCKFGYSNFNSWVNEFNHNTRMQRLESYRR